MNEPLYKIDERIANLLDFDDYMVDGETGEVVSLEDFEALMMSREEKIENWCMWIKNRAADVAALKAEIEKMTKRKQLIESTIENSKGRLQVYLAGEKVKTPRVSVSYRTTKSVDVTDFDSLPFDYLKVVSNPDKVKIGEDLKKGIEVPGAKLVERQSMTIR